jgi:hypothetical protein
MAELTVTVLKATELKNLEKKGKSDPFAVLTYEGQK